MNALFKSMQTSLETTIDQFVEKIAEEHNLDKTELLNMWNELCKEKKPQKKKKTGLKRKPSGYILFCKEERPKIKEDHPQMVFKDIGKELGKRWGDLGDAGKAEWNAKA